jgi:hypothetical protein
MEALKGVTLSGVLGSIPAGPAALWEVNAGRLPQRGSWCSDIWTSFLRLQALRSGSTLTWVRW